MSNQEGNSKSKTSSTSSWCDETTNSTDMDISTGHAILVGEHQRVRAVHDAIFQAYLQKQLNEQVDFEWSALETYSNPNAVHTLASSNLLKNNGTTLISEPQFFNEFMFSNRRR